MLRPANVSEMQMQKLWRYVRGKQSFSLLFVSFTFLLHWFLIFNFIVLSFWLVQVKGFL